MNYDIKWLVYLQITFNIYSCYYLLNLSCFPLICLFLYQTLLVLFTLIFKNIIIVKIHWFWTLLQYSFISSCLLHMEYILFLFSCLLYCFSACYKYRVLFLSLIETVIINLIHYSFWYLYFILLSYFCLFLSLIEWLVNFTENSQLREEIYPKVLPWMNIS